MTPVISVKNLKFGYPSMSILKDVNFTVNEGNMLIVCGLSGQGKSTLLRLIMGLEQLQGGTIKIFNKDVSLLNNSEFNKIKSKIGMVFQNSALLSTKTVEDNLRLPLVYHNLASGADLEKRINNTLEMLLIKEYRHNFPSELSLGLQKRTAMARAIITRPQLILMDEPTTGLDTISRGLLTALIENIRLVNNVSMIMVTNAVSSVRALDAEIGILKEGEMLEPMHYDELKKSMDSFVQSILEESAN